ncbi:hypothetical protein K1719_009286 [Acacia pycnantha]|nr:hypothetical protein K1719_009286 [Acacia pycnantha]
MASLVPGVLLNLLKTINSNMEVLGEHRLVLLQLGQFFYVEKMESAGTQVPVLVGVRPVPGRHHFVGDPKDLMQIILDPSEGNVETENEVVLKETQKKNIVIIKKEKAGIASRYMQGVSTSMKVNGPDSNGGNRGSDLENGSGKKVGPAKRKQKGILKVPAMIPTCDRPEALSTKQETAQFEAQREASAASVLVKCLSMFADLCSSAASENPHPTLNKRKTSLIPGKIKNTTLKSPKPQIELSVSGKLEWAKGDGPKEANELRQILIKETRSWFLKYLEKTLDSGFSSLVTQGKKDRVDKDIALTLSHLKNAKEWLDNLRSTLNYESEDMVETVERLKQKVCSCLLHQVGFAALALEKRA